MKDRCGLCYILTGIMLAHPMSIIGCKTWKYWRKLESVSSKRWNFWVTESSRTFCFNCVKSIWNKEQNVSRSTCLISKYGKCLTSFFDSFQMSCSKANFRCFLSFSGTMLIFFFFVIFPFSQLIHTAAGFTMILKFILYLQHRNILLLPNLTYGLVFF